MGQWLRLHVSGQDSGVAKNGAVARVVASAGGAVPGAVISLAGGAGVG